MGKPHLWRVNHPDFHPVSVVATDRPGAVLAACREWGAQADWRWLAGMCSAEKLGAAEKPKCRRCGAAFGNPGEPAGLCLECRKAEERFQRDKRHAFRYQDRRTKKDRTGG